MLVHLEKTATKSRQRGWRDWEDNRFNVGILLQFNTPVNGSDQKKFGSNVAMRDIFHTPPRA